MRFLAVITTAALLAGCATPPGPQREDEEQRLARECRDKGGVLLPGFGRLTGQPQVDNYCELRGGGTPTRPGGSN